MGWATLYLLRQRHDDDHDDHGGLHRDLSATGSPLGRREILRRFAFSADALALLGCRDIGSTANASRVFLASDNVFSDGSAGAGDDDGKRISGLRRDADGSGLR